MGCTLWQVQHASIRAARSTRYILVTPWGGYLSEWVAKGDEPLAPFCLPPMQNPRCSPSATSMRVNTATQLTYLPWRQWRPLPCPQTLAAWLHPCVASSLILPRQGICSIFAARHSGRFPQWGTSRFPGETSPPQPSVGL